MITSKFDLKTGLLHAKFTKEVTLQEVVGYIQETKENKSLPRELKIITDSRDANFVFGVNDLSRIVYENEQSLKQYQYIYDAIIVTDPKNTAISVLYSEMEKNPKYKFRVFSTHDAAVKWLIG